MMFFLEVGNLHRLKQQFWDQKRIRKGLFHGVLKKCEIRKSSSRSSLVKTSLWAVSCLCVEEPPPVVGVAIQGGREGG